MIPSLKFSCSNCSQNLSAPPELFGKQLNCPKCGTEIMVPNPVPNPESTNEEIDLGNSVVTPEVICCPHCRGDGAVACPECGGRTVTGCTQCDRSGIRQLTDWGAVTGSGKGGVGALFKEEQCIACRGTGWLDSPCASCQGSGRETCVLCEGRKEVDGDTASVFWEYKKKKKEEKKDVVIGCAVIIGLILIVIFVLYLIN